MKMIVRFLRWLFVYQPPAPKAPPAKKLCPVAGCCIPLRRDYAFCTQHSYLIPEWSWRHLRRMKRQFGPASLEYLAAINTAKNLIEREAGIRHDFSGDLPPT